MYGSNFCIVVLYPLACNNFAKDAAIIPFPSDDVTPPVTKIYLHCFICKICCMLLCYSKLGKITTIIRVLKVLLLTIILAYGFGYLFFILRIKTSNPLSLISYIIANCLPNLPAGKPLFLYHT